MRVDIQGDVNGQVAGRDIESHIRVDMQVGEGGSFDQHISIGTIFTGPVHIHLTIGRVAGDPGEK